MQPPTDDAVFEMLLRDTLTTAYDQWPAPHAWEALQARLATPDAPPSLRLQLLVQAGCDPWRRAALEEEVQK